MAEPVGQPFGQRVDEAARAGGVDGQQVSGWAQERNEQRRAERGASGGNGGRGKG